MAKKKTTPDTPATAKAAPARRRAPAKKNIEAAPPIDMASVAGAERYNTEGYGAEPGGNGRTQPSHDEIAEAAYFRHLKRGGGHGNEFNDWIEAERELRERRHR